MLLFLTLGACSPRHPLTCAASAHRGMRDRGPDNSLAAIAGAVNEGVPFIELDVRQSQDGTLFLFHEKHLRQPQIAGPAEFLGKRLEDLTSEQIRSLCLIDGKRCASIPTLCEALEVMSESKSVAQLDLKGASSTYLETIEGTHARCGKQVRILIQSDDPVAVRALTKRFSNFTFLGRAKSASEFSAWVAVRPMVIQGDSEWLTRKLIERAHAHGIWVLVKALTPSTEQERSYQELFRRGVDIILSDAPRAVFDAARKLPDCMQLKSLRD